jgi:hypothetical protein
LRSGSVHHWYGADPEQGLHCLHTHVHSDAMKYSYDAYRQSRAESSEFKRLYAQGQSMVRPTTKKEGGGALAELDGRAPSALTVTSRGRAPLPSSQDRTMRPPFQALPPPPSPPLHRHPSIATPPSSRDASQQCIAPAMAGVATHRSSWRWEGRKSRLRRRSIGGHWREAQPR